MTRQKWRYNRETQKMEEIPVTESKEVNAPWVNADEIEPTLSHATTEGRIFTSKAKLREHYRENGCIESGGWKPSVRKPLEVSEQEIRDTTEKAYNAIKYDKIYISEKEKELCRREERAYQEYKRRNR